MSRHWTREEIKYFYELVDGGMYSTPAIRRAMKARFGFDIGRSGVDLRLTEMGIERNRKYPAETRRAFQRMCLERPSDDIHALVAEFKAATGFDELYPDLARAWRKTADRVLGVTK